MDTSVYLAAEKERLKLERRDDVICVWIFVGWLVLGVGIGITQSWGVLAAYIVSGIIAAFFGMVMFAHSRPVHEMK